MEELIEFLKKLEKENEKAKRNFRQAYELGIEPNDIIHFKDGDVATVRSSKDNINYKKIAEVYRPVEYEKVSIRRPSRGRRRTNKGDK